MTTVKSIALAYNAAQDRILAVVNARASDTLSIWLTRRLILALLSRVPTALAASSPLTKQTPIEYRDEVVSFEHQTAMASTAGAMTRTEESVMNRNIAAAELAISLTISSLPGNRFRLEIRGDRGGAATGTIKRAELRRILQMMQDEVLKAGWLKDLAKSLASAETEMHLPRKLWQ